MSIGPAPLHYPAPAERYEQKVMYVERGDGCGRLNDALREGWQVHSAISHEVSGAYGIAPVLVILHRAVPIEGRGKP